MAAPATVTRAAPHAVSDFMIEMRNVDKFYGDFQVLRDCTTRVAKGEVVVVCGPSGSGKSTLVQCVNGLEPYQKGEIRIPWGDQQTQDRMAHLITQLRGWRPDVVHTHDLKPLLYAAPAARVARVPRIVHTKHFAHVAHVSRRQVTLANLAARLVAAGPHQRR